MLVVGRPATPAEFEEYYDLRWRLLREPWQQPRGSERDPLDADAEHVTARDETGRLLGVGRLHFNSAEEAQIRYMAIEGRAQGRGIGRAIIVELEARARAAGVNCITLEAREPAVGFYRRFGYRVTGPGPTKFGVIRHATMRKDLAG